MTLVKDLLPAAQEFTASIDIPIMLAYIMVAVAAIVAISFGIKKMIENTNDAKKTIYLLGGLLLILASSFVLASDTLLISYQKYETTKLTSKLVGMGIYSYSILGAIASLLILAYAIKRNWKKTIILIALMIMIISFVFNFSNIAIILTYLIIAIAVLATIIFGIKAMINNKKNTKKTLLTFGGLFIVFIIAYIFASDEVLKSFEKYKISNSTSKQVGMGIYTFYFLMIGTTLSVLYFELSQKNITNGNE
jgi:MFS family permease